LKSDVYQPLGCFYIGFLQNCTWQQ